MATIRVFLLTCRRPALLPRAIASLRAQTFTDWVCELHNDAPEDDTPRQLVEQIGDPRIVLHHHTTNWGPVATFNHAFAGGPEPYLSLLEDDNWWEPDFLATAVSALEAHPAATVAWSNLRIWRENPDHTWSDTGKLVWNAPPDDTRPRLFRWPIPLQAFDALHSNGAMLCRTASSRAARVPASTPFDVIEPVRERLLSGGWLLLPSPLANFSVTLQTSRSVDRSAWTRSQLLVAASYFLATHPSPEESRRIWATLRNQTPPSTNLLVLLALTQPELIGLLRFARPGDLIRFVLGSARHPHTLLRSLRRRHLDRELLAVLRSGAAARSSENPARESAPALYFKSLEQPGT